MDIFREYDVARDPDETVGKGLDNTEARLELLKREIVGETTIADLERDIRRKFYKFLQVTKFAKDFLTAILFLNRF